MQQETTTFNGISYAPGNTVSNDGDTLMLVNLRVKNNVLEPVTEGTPFATLSQQYDLIYLHPASQTQNWLGVIGNQLYTNILSTPVLIHTLDAQILKLNHIGNTLTAVTSSGFFYFLYKDAAYLPLGTKPPLPDFTYIHNYPRINFLRFNDIEGTITDTQSAMEALHIKNRWSEDHAFLLCGAYLLTYCLRLYDNTCIRHSAPLFICSDTTNSPLRTSLGYIGDTLHYEFSSTAADLYSLSCTFTIPPELIHWKDIVKSVDIFISPELGAYSETFRKIEDCRMEITPPGADRVTHKSFYPTDFDTKTIANNIADTLNFFFIKSIPLAEAGNTTVRLPEKADISTLQNLVHQEQMPVDDFTHHLLTANYTYTYNQRLHIANIQTTFFEGFNLRTYTPRIYSTGSGSSRPGTTILPPKQVRIDKAFIKVYINVKDQAHVISFVADLDIYEINPLFSYPDTRAYKAHIIITDNNNNIQKDLVIPLQPHPHLNLAYYIEPSLKEIVIPDTTSSHYNPTYTPVTIQEENKIKVSALQNPFVFPVENTYLASSEVIGMATNTQPISEGQFGQFPLYVFHREGISALQIGDGNVLYSNLIPASQEVALSSSVTPVSNAVFFLTLRGAFLLSAGQTVNISPQLNKDTPVQEMQHLKSMILTLFPQLPERISFYDFIHQPDINVHYNYRQDELMIVSQTAGYAFVFNFASKAWHTTTHIFTPVQNTYPRLYGLVGNTIFDISAESPTPTPVLLLTRPLKFRSEQYKTLIRHVLRCRMVNTGDAAFFTYASDDAENFRLKSNLRLLPGSYHDIDTGLIANCKYKYFALLLITTLQPDSRINYLQSVYSQTYNNTKLR